MKACAIHNYGGIEELKIEDMPIPKPGPWDVLIELKSASLNHLDIWVRNGVRAGVLKEPQIMGSDGSGIVKEIGSDVHGISIGQEVVLHPGLSCGCCEFCLKGEHSECNSYEILGMSRPGTFAEYVSAPAFNIFPKPPHLNFNESAGFPLTFLTAWRMLIVKGKLEPGQVILIHGIGGGVALAGLILAKTFGARVIVTSSSLEKLKKAEKLGADNIINYKNQDVAGEVKKITNSRGVDIAFDTVGSASFPLDFDCVRKGGRIVLCGVTSGPKSEINLMTLYWKQISVFGSTMGSTSDFRSMLNAININKIKPLIDSIWPLNKIQSATKKMEEGKQFGKIVLEIQS